MTDRPAFFEPAGDGFTPNAIAGSPWGPGQLNGVAIGGLLAHSLLAAHPPQDMNIARFTLDILGRAPMAPIQAHWRPLREGRRTTVVEGRLVVEGADVARATALFVRKAEEGGPATIFAPPDPLPQEAASADLMMSLKTGLESRLLQRGAAGADQPLGRVWVRPITSIVAGFSVDPVAAAVIASDFGGGLSSGIDRAAWTSPNVDIAVHFVRPPRDEWVLVEAQTLLPGNGSALVETRLSDRFGLFGQAHQILAVAPAPRRAVEARP
jgi:acyl-coenzyme A thioesterase PaaI-like protein